MWLTDLGYVYNHEMHSQCVCALSSGEETWYLRLVDAVEQVYYEVHQLHLGVLGQIGQDKQWSPWSSDVMAHMCYIIVGMVYIVISFPLLTLWWPLGMLLMEVCSYMIGRRILLIGLLLCDHYYVACRHPCISVCVWGMIFEIGHLWGKGFFWYDLTLLGIEWP